jgi:hypothetical protein
MGGRWYSLANIFIDAPKSKAIEILKKASIFHFCKGREEKEKCKF